MPASRIAAPAPPDGHDNAYASIMTQEDAAGLAAGIRVCEEFLPATSLIRLFDDR
jgi:hypothetical protein